MVVIIILLLFYFVIIQLPIFFHVCISDPHKSLRQEERNSCITSFIIEYSYSSTPKKITIMSGSPGYDSPNLYKSEIHYDRTIEEFVKKNCIEMSRAKMINFLRDNKNSFHHSLFDVVHIVYLFFHIHTYTQLYLRHYCYHCFKYYNRKLTQKKTY